MTWEIMMACFPGRSHSHLPHDQASHVRFRGSWMRSILPIHLLERLSGSANHAYRHAQPLHPTTDLQVAASSSSRRTVGPIVGPIVRFMRDHNTSKPRQNRRKERERDPRGSRQRDPFHLTRFPGLKHHKRPRNSCALLEGAT